MSTTTFQSVNSAREDRSLPDDPNSPTTPRAGTAPSFTGQDASSGRGPNPTATSNIIALDLPGQRPLPTTPFTVPTQFENRGVLPRGGSRDSVQSTDNAGDMDLDAMNGDQGGSDNDTENGDPTRSSKKKKGQKFFCTDYPPCNLSFTRSEHLARHIRKHTGERPFQCHCNRRFSRLDNLRQHAQTVHVNEDIPAESLAATGTRYQRQIRTEKLRPTTSRVRSGNLGGQNNHPRGHSRNLSASSIGSTASNYSTAEPRRRPPPLLMASDGAARPRLALETPATPPPPQYHAYSADSPSGMTTPASATFSANPSSPGYGSFTDSPVSTTARMASLYGNGTPGRRLSVPSGVNVLQSPHGHHQPHSHVSPSSASNSQVSNSPIHFPTNTSSRFPPSCADVADLSAEAESRRRTWHPSSYASTGSHYSRPATSRLSFSQTPDTIQSAVPIRTIPSSIQPPRLPGIESFDQVQHRPSTPPRRQPSPMQIDSQPQPAPFGNPDTAYGAVSRYPDHRRAHFSWDGSHSARFARSDLQTSLSRDASCAHKFHDSHTVSSRPIPLKASLIKYRPGQTGMHKEPPRHIAPEKPHLQPSTPYQNNRSGRYNNRTESGSQNTQLSRTSPEDSSSSEGVPTPGTLVTDVHPAIMYSNSDIGPLPHHPILTAEAAQNVRASCPREKLC